MSLPANNERHLVGTSGDDRVSLFYDGRVKVWSTAHVWTVLERGRHNALGEMVLLGRGRDLTVPGPTERQQRPRIEVALDSGAGHAVASTIAGDNGTFVQLFHDGAIAVGNDGRDIEQILNAGREAGPDGKRNGVGGSVMIGFAGSYRPRDLRAADHYVTITELRPRPAFRLYPDEFEI